MKNTILEYMRTNTYGFRNAKPRCDIISALNKLGYTIGDRSFRKICEELKKEKHIATNCKDGYYFIPLFVLRDPEEIAALEHSINDKRSRARMLFDEADAMAERLIAERIRPQGQQELFVGVR